MLSLFRATPAAGLVLMLGGGSCLGSPSAPAPPAPVPQTLYIREFRVLGARELPRIEVEETVYPFLGPGRTAEDVEQARAALEKAYQEKGFQGASVQVPPQQGLGGVVYLQVSAGTVGQLRVRGARYFLPSAIKARAQSLAEGKALNFNNVSRDVIALNQLPDRQITPELRPGEVPGTLDVDLIVKDKLPLHGSVELNNRYTANTKPLRLSASLNYNNIWQLGHTIGASYQVAPQRRADTEIISAYYIARFPGTESFSLMLQGRKQDSNVRVEGPGGSTVSTSNEVVAPGESYGVRALFTLPPLKDFYHSFTFGVD
jgi:hemolysin activation/secretion protein